ncbi:MAG: TetR family transcriptional regulator [Candidatus Latescibacteria bacterium]|nr:TetR family transcriptional regulator [Candidatus Latescibacterota bacterium]NIM22563.1 TetR family transcriptional regulator [Candidatus Latescibacterota bacterium]NIM64852.1 TetR family transcriptional regulator [Candidatus Latescibacterota bacterium]NIO01367.1 TetR family transcriptional regulator [Candidatus Latescibacterota bacterium]NIO27877.1 TetR family transcriptional regulator [Candidatus Latescibacterota bacterium]
MGIPERKAREKEQRRRDIIQTAERVFLAKGLKKATMDDVAEAAELSKGTLYLYFKNKEELYAAVILQGVKVLRSMFEAAVDSAQSGIEKVRAIGRAYADFHKEHPDYFDAVLYYQTQTFDSSGRDSLVAACNSQSDETIGVIAEALKAGISDGTIRNDIDPSKAAVVLWGQTTGIMQLASRKGNEIRDWHHLNPEDVISGYFDLVEYGLKAE